MTPEQNKPVLELNEPAPEQIYQPKASQKNMAFS